MKFRIHFLPAIISLIGVLGIFGSWIRWTVAYNDLSQAILGISISIIVFGCGYVYNWMKNVEETIRKMQTQLDAIGGLVTGNEEEAKKEAAIGLID